ncbi:hypothetical protein FOXYS1_3850 [Fusarium oxysporum]|uniref:Transcription factor domain-containing protein n=1 Tax=Fusarium oxysporum TaxID=5507 RepID=A0A8H5AJK7_FUSOX|nr:hypothetical protein FOXYS1_3850 [Fusarium oxysporum]
MAKPTVTLIPWDPNCPEHVRRMVEQRIICGWQASTVPTEWKDGHINGTKCVYWIIFPQEEPQREKYLKMHTEAYPKETEELLDSSKTLLGKPRVPTDAKFLPVGHVALDTHISDYAEKLELEFPKSDAYWVKSLYVSYRLQGLGVGGAAMKIAERVATEEPLNARHLLLDTVHQEDQANEEFAIAVYGGAFKIPTQACIQIQMGRFGLSDYGFYLNLRGPLPEPKLLISVLSSNVHIISISQDFGREKNTEQEVIGMPDMSEEEGQMLWDRAFHVEDLENRLAQYEGRNQDTEDWVPDAVDVPSPFSSVHGAQQPQDTPPVAPSPIPRSTTRPATSIPLTGRSIETDSSLSSSATFGFRVQNLLTNARHIRDIPRPAAHVSNNHNSSPRQANNTYHGSLPLLPSESEAYRLLDVVTLYIGQSQSHFDAREVSDNIELYYTDPEGQLPPTPWFLRMSIIFAVGKLMSGESSASNGDTDLGTSLFEFVHAQLPTPSEQHAQGRVAIETLTLLGVYLQAMNRKEEAYIYTSITLRLAVTHGYHRPLEGTRILRSEKAHIAFVNMSTTRRLAAATGHPYGIDDAFIVLEYPTDQPGFSSTQPIRTNARIARVTSRILIDLYSPNRQHQDSFVHDVKEIIRCLHDISSEIPENLATVAHGPNANVSVRTTASLQLMLYQLCRACTEAARRIVRTIIKLRRMNLLAIFGFFDCDAIFSATFVLILTAVFDSSCEDKDKINPSPGLGEAIENLQYLADNHNTTAVERLQEINDILHHLPEHLRTNEGTAFPLHDRSQPAYDHVCQAADGSRGHDPAEPLNNTGETDDITQPVVDPALSRAAPDANRIEQDRLALNLDAEQHPTNFNDLSQLCIPSAVNTGTVPSDDLIPTDIPLDEYYGYFQSLLDNSDWYLTGQDVGDLAEFGRHVVNFSRSE